MKLSAPVNILRRQARALSRKEQIPLHQALDRIARREGFYDFGRRPVPGLGDVRLPNPVDLALFDRTCFLNRGNMEVIATA